MSEENKHPGKELHDAALEGVSGGSSYDLAAADLCYSCPRYRNNCGTGSSRQGELVEYMKARHCLLYSYTQCPCYND